MWRAGLPGPLLVGLAFACGGGGEDLTGAKPMSVFPTETLFCSMLAWEECNPSVVKACYGSDRSTLVDDQRSCAQARQEHCNPDGLSYVAEDAEECVTMRRRALADAVWTQTEVRKAREACLTVFSKGGMEGEACTRDSDCDTPTGLRCVMKPGKAKGQCADPEVARGGETCAAPGAVCESGFYCDPLVLHCLAGRGEGEPCAATFPCGGNFYCPEGQGSTCQQKKPNGRDCLQDEVCAGGFCTGASAGQSGVCTATLPLQINTESCDLYR